MDRLRNTYPCTVPDESLGWKYMEREEAFWRKLPEECRLGSAIKLFGKKMKNNIKIVGNNFRTTQYMLNKSYKKF